MRSPRLARRYRALLPCRQEFRLDPPAPSIAAPAPRVASAFLDLADAHVRADRLSDADAATLARFGVRTVLACAHDDSVDRASGPTVDGWLRFLESLLAVHSPRLRRAGLRPLFAFGIHPAALPSHGFDALLHELPSFLSDPAAVAVGSLGLNVADARERHALAAQLALAAELRRPAVVAAPPLAPDKGPALLADLARDAGLPAHRVLVENVTAATAHVFSSLGFTVALEPSEGRLSEEELVALVSKHGPDRFVLSSHAGATAASLLAVPAALARLHDAGLSDDVLTRVGRGNLLRFLGRPDAGSLSQARGV